MSFQEQIDTLLADAPEEVSEYRRKAKKMDDTEKRSAYRALTESAKILLKKIGVLKVFATSEPDHSRAVVHTSPSGKYRLTITPYTTGKHTWGYTQGTVATAEGHIIEEVLRNYSSFPFLWVEDHANGRDYLVCGADYQGQTVIELDTGTRWDHLPEAASIGAGFCWVEYRYLREHQLIMVDGCFWGGPYEHRFHDFSDPSKGWPILECDKFMECSDDRPPEIVGDTITTYVIEDEDEEGNDVYWDESGLPVEEWPVAEKRVFRIEGNTIKHVSTEVSENRKQQAIRNGWGGVDV